MQTFFEIYKLFFAFSFNLIITLSVNFFLFVYSFILLLFFVCLHAFTRFFSGRLEHLRQEWPTFFLKPPILFKSSSYPPHKKGHRWKKFSKFLLFLLKPSCSLKKRSSPDIRVQSATGWSPLI